MALAFEDISWLPTEEDLLLMDKENFDRNGLNSAEFNPSLNAFPTEFPYEFDPLDSPTALGSPVESVVGSTETESSGGGCRGSSDEEELLAVLTQRLTQRLIVKPEKKWVVAGSPESTLNGIGSWSVSSNGSPNGVLSPPTTPFAAKDETWNLIYAAAGQVARLKMGIEANNIHKCSNFQGRGGFLGPVGSQSLESSSVKNHNFYSNQSFGPNISRVNQHNLRQERVLKQQCSAMFARQQVKAGSWQAQPQPLYHQQQNQIQSCGRSLGYESGRPNVRPLTVPQSSWPSLHVQQNQHHQTQHSNSGMRAVFLGESGARRECTGTGVFLPRGYGKVPADTKKKSACPAVLLPAKVVQALNLNFDDMNLSNGHPQPQLSNAFASDYDALIARRNALLAQQKRSVLNHEIRLPQEWTY